MARDMAAQLTDLLGPRADDTGFELVLVEVTGSQRAPLVSVYLDHEGGITIDQIAEASRWVRDTLDMFEGLPDAYTLEVSSPGIDRPLVTIAHFERFIGSDAKFTVSPEIDGRKRFTGTILGVEGDDVLVDAEGTNLRVPFRSITRARLRAEIDFGKEGTAHDGL